GADRRAFVRRGAWGALPRGAGRDRGAAHPGDLAAGPGARRAGGGRRAGLRPALGGAAGRALQRARPRRLGRPAAPQRPRGERADARAAGRARRALAAAARGRGALDRSQGGALDGRPARGRAGARAARLGSSATGPLVDPGAAPAPPAIGHGRAAGRVQGGLDAAVARAEAEHPGQRVEVWAEDEHRLGL
ncbi:MAG: hypothetical protein AVDCRST_MAG11-4014, partial [uncultured Gemmatimonadaceae bacterium]